jgi:hypothetical protein
MHASTRGSLLTHASHPRPAHATLAKPSRHIASLGLPAVFAPAGTQNVRSAEALLFPSLAPRRIRTQTAPPIRDLADVTPTPPRLLDSADDSDATIVARPV